MAEPATTTATLVADAIRLPVVAITGTVLGMYYDALLFGFVAALLTLLMMPPRPDVVRPPLRIFGMVLGAAFLAGVFAPAGAAAMPEYLPWSGAIDVGVRRIIVATLLGISVGIEGLPLLLGYIKRRWLP